MTMTLNFVLMQFNLPVPDDVKIVGVSIVTVLMVIGAVLKNVVFRDKAQRKLIPWILMLIGVILSAFAGIAFYPDKPVDFAAYIAFGVWAGIQASGLHTTFKNSKEYFKKKD